MHAQAENAESAECMCTLVTSQRERERERKKERGRKRQREKGREKEGERKREGEKEKNFPIVQNCYLFKGMTGAFAPFSYLVCYNKHFFYCCAECCAC